MNKFGLKIENYKCFSKEIGFDEIKPINIVIGKNNTGKSTLIDMVEFYYNDNKFMKECKRNNKLKLIVNKNLLPSDFSGFSSTYCSNISITRDRKTLVEKDSAIELFTNKNFSYSYRNVGKRASYSDKIEIEHQKTYIESKDFDESQKDINIKVLNGINIEPKITKRIYSERNIVPELENNLIEVDGHGNGASNIINKFINKSDLDSKKVQVELLSKLNEIIGDDTNFTNIVVQTIEDNEKLVWEIFLEEEEKGLIPLSNSGSGLKTIILLLIYTILIPEKEEKEISDYVFILEELENNLHPALQRNVIKYIESLTEKGAIFFITTHSNIFIDSFVNKDIVNLYHLYRKDNELVLENVEQNNQKYSILDDVGFKASDILQSNGVIWVEGPSDRIYINKWIELWSNGKYKEGKDYSCVFYGGKLLSHLTYDDTMNELVNLLKVNRNSIIIIDSDKKTDTKYINKTKTRIKNECNENNIMCWITKGREVENYVPQSSINSILKNPSGTLGQFEDIKNYLNNQTIDLGEKFESSKVFYARQFVKNMILEECNQIYDLDSKMKEVISLIEKWNK